VIPDENGTYLLNPAASGAWFLTRKNADGTFTSIDRYSTKEEAEAAMEAEHG
jgi:hypothetical protein